MNAQAGPSKVVNGLRSKIPSKDKRKIAHKQKMSKAVAEARTIDALEKEATDFVRHIHPHHGECLTYYCAGSINRPRRVYRPTYILEYEERVEKSILRKNDGYSSKEYPVVTEGKRCSRRCTDRKWENPLIFGPRT